MKPAHEFSALWLDTSTLQLTPVGPLPSGEKLQLTLHRQGLLLDSPIANTASAPDADFSHPVQVLPQQISLREVGFQQVDENAALSYQFEVHTLDPVSQSQIKQIFAVSQQPATATSAATAVPLPCPCPALPAGHLRLQGGQLEPAGR